MSRPRNVEDLVRVHLWLYQSDLDWMRRTFGATLGTSQVVRSLVRRARKEIETAVDGQGQTPTNSASSAIKDILQNESSQE